MVHLGAIATRRIDQCLVQGVSARCVKRTDPVLRGNLDVDWRLLAIDECSRPHRRYTCRSHIVQHTPVCELHHSAAHQSVSRHRIATVRLTVDNQDARALPREQHPCRCASATRANDYRIVMVMGESEGGHSKFLSSGAQLLRAQMGDDRLSEGFSIAPNSVDEA